VHSSNQGGTTPFLWDFREVENYTERILILKTYVINIKPFQSLTYRIWADLIRAGVLYLPHNNNILYL